ncbi:XXYS1_4_G0000900.mRNA.1.CDS.1 [Saccharomyces cerevisiae]|nr:EM14S01-3B_G0054510.mRNA.1.CDS.1 [Saccharomyces cerevisiae]CAD6629640.1 XXYS1_4_G0000900.mRNA.1.CDS.1 [Saccharomyces cerevisiae]CAI4514801.1 AMH_1a_G0023590.mRNA.1.CDS.1 [Saccharomyces cerevisiae]CAI4522356.1 CEI_1a_G0023510.mRNA.1.CDS.1 [Saccharomyces cerevisiae]CAI6703933.1 AMH_1a_G0023590.mRNA.1.CDS.1 [Saccharomyces cerevisiae]
MSKVYLNSDMINHLNSTVQAYFNLWLEKQNVIMRSQPQIIQDNQKLIGITTLVASIFTLYVLVKIISTPTKCSSSYKPVKFTLPAPEAAQNNWKGKRSVSTNIWNPEEPNFIQCHCPATGQYLGSFPSKTEADIDEMVSKAGKAQSTWGNSDFSRRLRVLASLHDYILNNQDLIARVACRDSGKTMLDASMGEILVTLEKIQWTIKHGQRALQPSRRPGPTNFFMKWYKGAEIRYEPLGVISSIVSWNYPFHNLLGPIIAALFTGNAIVVKCSEQVVWSSEFFVELIRKCLEACDEDPDLVQLCYCLPPTENDDSANYFTSHPGFKHITFIGSQPVAHYILKCAAKSLTPVVVELGGKDAFIVLDSAKNLDALSSIIMRGTFQSSGQNCIGIERVIVSKENYDDLVKILNDRMTANPLRQGSDIDHLENVDMGAMISDNRFNELEALVKDAVAKGARLLQGGSRFKHPKYPQGHYFQPTLLVDVTPEMKIAQNEVFGPILVMMKAKNTDHCVQLANSAPFGLGGSVFGADIKECNYVANSLQTGNVAINDFATFYVCQLPFGGINGSGYGKFGGEEGLLGLCNAKSVCFDTLPFVSTQIPKPLDYPIRNNAKAWNFVKSFIVGAYTNSTWQRIKSLFSLAKEAS